MYGYNFTKRNNGGLGAIIHDIMNAVAYTREHNLTFCFTKEGYDIPRFNGSVESDLPDVHWHSFFSSFDIVDESQCVQTWPTFIPDTTFTPIQIENYSNIVQHIFKLQDSVKDEVKRLVDATPFQPSDVVLHVRRTDKITESELLPLDIYIRECERAISLGKTRIYICTDEKWVAVALKQQFQPKVEVVWDTTESDDPLQYLRYTNQLEKSVAQKETITALKNLYIMEHCDYLIGGRMSYFFRVAELLRYPKISINLKDNDVFGVAPYAITPIVRPYKKKTIPHFINGLDLTSYAEQYKKEHIVCVPNLINETLLNELHPELDNYKWWNYAITPVNSIWNVEYYDPTLDLSDRFNECDMHLMKKEFCYRFKRSLKGHYETCNCISCKLCDTVESFPVTDALSKIVGCDTMVATEVFISNYGKDDFISIHHDKKKGDIAVTFSLCEWHPTYGGILHFCDKETIYKSISPQIGNVTIFKVYENGINHFVSKVNVNKNRYTITAWYTIQSV